MNAATIFARLSSKASDYGFMPFGDSTKVIDLAMYTKGMYRRAYIAARFVWSKDLSVTEELSAYIKERMLKTAKMEGWRFKKVSPDIFVQLAMVEHYAPGVFTTQKSRYTYCGISEQDWFRTWKKRYEISYEILGTYLDIAWGSTAK